MRALHTFPLLLRTRSEPCSPPVVALVLVCTFTVLVYAAAAALRALVTAFGPLSGMSSGPYELVFACFVYYYRALVGCYTCVGVGVCFLLARG